MAYQFSSLISWSHANFVRKVSFGSEADLISMPLLVISDVRCLLHGVQRHVSETYRAVVNSSNLRGVRLLSLLFYNCSFATVILQCLA